MIRKQYVLLILAFLLGLLVYHLASLFFFAPAMAIFSPEEGDEIISFIDSAEHSIDIEMYVFSSEEVVAALQRAKDRGVHVRIILERRTLSNNNEETFEELLVSGIDVRWASEIYKLTHSKFIIVDDRVLVGSHNFSNSALNSNREASVILSGSVVEEFKRIFELDWNLAA